VPSALRAIPFTLCVTVAAACSRGPENRVTPPASVDAQGARTEEPAPEHQGSTVVLRPDGKPEVAVRVRVARTEGQRRRGLMYVQSLPPDDGMLFVFQEDEVQGFWMKNTLIPLDMIFISKDLEVVGVVENAEPMTTEERGVDAESRYVLEVNGGYARAKGIGPGTKVELRGI
jgi:uncharacterized membrane protein (UPF0127 family)